MAQSRFSAPEEGFRDTFQQDLLVRGVARSILAGLLKDDVRQNRGSWLAFLCSHPKLPGYW
jgi:hypothetical protein